MIKNFSDRKTFGSLVSLAEELLSKTFSVVSGRNCDILIKSASLSDDMKTLTMKFVPYEDSPNLDYIWQFNMEHLLRKLEENRNEN